MQAGARGTRIGSGFVTPSEETIVIQKFPKDATRGANMSAAQALCARLEGAGGA